MLAFIAAGVHIWGQRCLSQFHNATALTVDGASVGEMVANLRRVVPPGSSLVAHDIAGLVALTLSYESPELVRSITIVSSMAAAPTGDRMADYTLAYVPKPVSSRASSRWAIERVSYSHHHIDDDLVDDYVALAGRPQPDDLMAAKTKFFAACRDKGFPVPAQVVWGTHDPLGSVETGLWLFRLIASRQRVAHFHVINRAGALPFREEPDMFHQIVSAFVESV
jgi:pimeloyl-ACP methyl ester carboxylesterase